MSPAQRPSPPEIAEWLTEFPVELFDERSRRSWEQVDQYGTSWVFEVARQLELEHRFAKPATVEQTIATSGWVGHFAAPLTWLLERLCERGVVARTIGGPLTRYVAERSFPRPDLETLATACLAHDPANAPALALLDLAGNAYGAVARGETTGQDTLFGLGQTKLWLEYFDNGNPTYAINNRLSAVAARNRLPARPGLAVVEVGGGGGSGTEALLEATASPPAPGSIGSYHFTEPSPFFRRRAERSLRSANPEIDWIFEALDIDRPFADQGVEPATVDLVYAVNVLHVARDLPTTLGWIRESLAPAGWLVAGEAIRPTPTGSLSTELVFHLLESYRDVELDPVLRPTPGFLTALQWKELLIATGYSVTEVVPDHASIARHYDRFSTGVICGQP